jgi:16S rRNA (guanine(966)-N(2))-methyltransferase RsmD
VSPNRRPQQVRIIAGQWKRTPLPVVNVDGLRPTPDRVRETVFNWLEHLQLRRWDHLRCLDLFAGTGALGFEAASRGAAEVVMIESHPAALKNLQAIHDKLQAQQVILRRGDASQLLPTLAGKFDLVFLDPPYQQRQLPALLPEVLKRLNPEGLVYIESDQAFASNGTLNPGRTAQHRQSPNPQSLNPQSPNPQSPNPLQQSGAGAPDWLSGWQVVRSDKAGQVHFALLRAAAPEFAA